MMPKTFTRQHLTASALIGTGIARLSRLTRRDEACVLTFHGLRASDSINSGLLDIGLHTPQPLFQTLCAHLAEHYRVRPLVEIISTLMRGAAPPDRTIALTFDDGYESNFELAWPALREFNLPATIFLCTGFVDGTVSPWFHRLELAVARATVASASLDIGADHFELSLNTVAARRAAHATLSPAFKRLPQVEMERNLMRVERALQPEPGEIPVPLRALNWTQAREMMAGGLIEFGAHTHSHPILRQCSEDVARKEIHQSRDRIATELGVTPTLFAYPNGLENDYNARTQALLREAGFIAAFTMIPGSARSESSRYLLPRYGSPESMSEAEATVSGAFETFKQWRRHLRSVLIPSA